MNHKTAVGRLKEYETTPQFTAFIHLLATDLQEMRESMDVAEKDQVKMTQGSIRYVKKLIKELDPKGRRKLPVYDGGFGD